MCDKSGQKEISASLCFRFERELKVVGVDERKLEKGIKDCLIHYLLDFVLAVSCAGMFL